MNKPVLTRLSADWLEQIPFILFIIYLLILPYERILTTFMNAFFVLILVAVGLKTLVKGINLTLSKDQVAVLFLLGALLGWLILGSVIRIDSVTAITSNKTVLLHIGVIFIFLAEVNTLPRVRTILLAVSSIAAIIGFLSLIHLVVGLPFGRPATQSRSLGPLTFQTMRLLGAPMGYGAYGILTSLGGTFAAGVAIWPHKLVGYRPDLAQSWASVSLVGMAIGVFLGQSRSTYLALAASAVVAVILLSYSTQNRTLKRVVKGGAVVTGFVAVLVGVAYLGGFLVGSPESLSRRLQQYEIAIGIMLSDPMFGCGWDCARTVTAFSVSIHNSWLFMGAVGGVVVLFLWAAVFGLLSLGLFKQISARSHEMNSRWRIFYRLPWPAGEAKRGSHRPNIRIDRFRPSFATVADNPTYRDRSTKGDLQLLGMVVTVGFVGVCVEMSLYPGVSDIVGIALGTVIAVIGLEQNDYELRVVPGVGESDVSSKHTE